MISEKIKKDNNKIFRTYTKNEAKSPVSADFNIAEWAPRNNSVILKAVLIKKASGIILAGENNTGDMYGFYIYKVGLNCTDLIEKIGKAVILRDYSEIACQPINFEQDKSVVYFLCFEHNITLVEE